MVLKNKQLLKEVVTLLSNYSSADRLHVGAVLIKDGRIICTGYNGHPNKQPHKCIMKNGHDVSTIHAEMNILCFCARHGIKTNDCTMVVSHFPCMNCTKHLYQAGIKNVYYINDYHNKDNYYWDLIKIKQIDCYI